MFRVGARRARKELLPIKLSGEFTVMLVGLLNDREEARKVLVLVLLRPEKAVMSSTPPVPTFKEEPKVWRKMLKEPKGLVAAPLLAMTVLPEPTAMGLSTKRLMFDA